MSSTQSKNPNRVAGGYKATLHNPNISDEAKQSAKERLDEMGAELKGCQKRVEADQAGSKNIGNVIGGHQATLSNPNTSADAKEHSREFLQRAGDDEEQLADADYDPDEDE